MKHLLRMVLLTIICDRGRVVNGCAGVTTPATTTTTTNPCATSTSTSTTTTTTTTTTQSTCSFNSMLDNSAAFAAGTSPCASNDCTGTACSCTMANGATVTISANQCVDNQSFCVTSNGVVSQVTSAVAGSTIICLNGVAGIIDTNGAATSPLDLVACSVITSAGPPPVIGCA